MRRKIEQVGDERIVTKFLLFPKIINDEERWLERATWVERLYEGILMSDPDFWLPVYWLDTPTAFDDIVKQAEREMDK